LVHDDAEVTLKTTQIRQFQYTLTSTTSAGAKIKPLLPGGDVLTAQEVDTSVGGLVSLDKAVGAGDRFFFLTGPTTLPSPVFTNTNSFIGDARYDTMNALVSFTLSPNSNVGISGLWSNKRRCLSLPLRRSCLQASAWWDGSLGGA